MKIEDCNNIITCNDFSNEQDILDALRFILKNPWNRSKWTIAFAFQSNTGEFLSEKEFYEMAVKVKGAPKIMAKIAQKAFDKHSIDGYYGQDGLSNAFSYLFYYLILEDNSYYILGWGFCANVDLDHSIEDALNIINISRDHLDDNTRNELYEDYPSVRNWLDDQGHGL